MAPSTAHAAPSGVAARAERASDGRSPDAQAEALRLRTLLRDFAERAAAGRIDVQVPVAHDEVERGPGHFHLASELFVQVGGWTRFAFPHGPLRLAAGEALLLPPRLRHDERVGAGSGASGAREPFCNLVIYAEGGTLTCHLAHEQSPGRPGIAYLEASRHPQVLRIHDWLADAARLGQPNASHAGGKADARAAAPWPALQVRALVAAAAAGVLRALDDAGGDAPSEPPLVSRIRVLVQNQLGDQALGVKSLAAQTGYTPDYLSHLFRRATGEYLAAYIVRQRMARAAHLLDESAMAGKEIAWACGFATPGYFIRSFRAQFGMTPQAWRARQRSPATAPPA